jgi:hypothetical protein
MFYWHRPALTPKTTYLPPSHAVEDGVEAAEEVGDEADVAAMEVVWIWINLRS